MVLFNGEVIQADTFPDGSLHLKNEKTGYVSSKFINISLPRPGGVIDWHYENDAELFIVICLAKQYRAKTLNLPYCPHARMDRIKSDKEVFTLKWFADTINSLGFETVKILDPHSNVSAALIDHAQIEKPSEYIGAAINHILTDGTKYTPRLDISPLEFFYPDEGAMKRYSSVVEVMSPPAYGSKTRDWDTGKILGLEIHNAEAIKGQDVLIIDDICSRGGTFYHSAKALKEAGAKDIYLYVTHCEKTILDGEIFSSGLIKRVYTTNSIFQSEWVGNNDIVIFPQR